MGCSGSKTEPSPRKPQRNYVRGNSVKEKRIIKNNNKTQYEPIYEPGWKKRVRENLRNAAAGEDIDQLEKCMEIFVNNRLQDGGDLTEAKRRMDFLETRKCLRDACMRQHPQVLDKAIQRTENSPYRRQLKSMLDRAYYLKQHQEELDTFRHDILNMEQTTISEIRSYNHPNGAVHCTMAATYLCIGYPESHLLDWVEVTALMGRYGKDSLIREISLADTRKLDKQTAALARSYLNQYSFEEVRSVSNGAAVFYLWASKMVGKYEGDKKGASAGQPQPKQLTNSRRGNTPTNTEQNQGQFKARPVPTGQSVRESSQYQNQKQTKSQQNQAKQAQKTTSKQSPQTSAKTAQKNVKNTKTQAKKSG